MAPPPAKRQRKLLASSPDSEDRFAENRASTKSHAGAGTTRTSESSTKLRSKVCKSGSKTSPTSSPGKRKQKAQAGKITDKTTSLLSFFPPATEEERWRTGVSQKQFEAAEEIDDDIEDDSLDDTTRIIIKKTLPLDRRKSSEQLSNNVDHQPQSQHPPANGSQRFARPNRGQLSSSDSSTKPNLLAHEEEYQPWAARFGPESLEELVVHKKKLSDVRRWLTDVFDGHIKQKALVLKGPAGSGKSTTISLLAKALKASVYEWKNPDSVEPGSQATAAAQFNDFLNRGGTFSGLTLENTAVQDYKGPSPESSRKILVVEEFPTSILRSSASLHNFRASLLQYLSSAYAATLTYLGEKHAVNKYPPIVIIISEALLTSSISASETFTAHKVLGPQIMNHPAVATIEFNPLAPSFITKALDLTMKKEARHSKRRRTPGPAVIKRLSEMGDVRSAVNCLEFLCVRGDQSSDWSGRVAAKSKKFEKEGGDLTEMEKQSLELVTQREATLGMFHAVGKVVYNKRDDPRLPSTGKHIPPQPPEHLKRHSRFLVPQTSIDELLNETGTDTHTFISSLHENYILSCGGPQFVDCFADCADILSSSDILASAGMQRLRTNKNMASAGPGFSSTSTVDSMRQIEVCFHVVVRGLLLALPSPVTRAQSTAARKGDANKMFYPMSLKIWKMIEEVSDLVDGWLTRINGPAQPSGTDMQRVLGATEGVASWKSWSRGFDEANDASESAESASRTMTSRDDLLLERLPYMKIISRRDAKQGRELDRLVTFSGVGLQRDADEEDGDVVGTNASNELAVEERSPGKVGRWKDTGPVSIDTVLEKYGRRESAGVGIEKLYISDDDIEDD